MSTFNLGRITTAAGLYAAVSLLVLTAAGCSDGSNNTTGIGGGGEKSISFVPVNSPETDSEKREILATNKVTINGTDYDTGFKTIMRSGDQSGSGTFGQIYDKNGSAVLATDGSPKISNDNDFASLLTGSDGKLYMVSHFESRPGGMYLTELSQDSASGELSPVQTRNLDFSHVNGGWVHCAGSVTPWGTHLGSEEYEPDAEDRDPVTGEIDGYYNAMGDYAGGDLTQLNPYDYGWQVEVKVDDFDTATVTKHYAMGRVAHELAYVMPNQKTAYISDDGTNVGLFRFEADTAADLSAGELFVARWVQTSKQNGGRADLEWISLGSATDAEIKTYLDNKITFANIFDKADPDADDVCPATFTSINTTRGRECLKVKAGMEKAASRMETRRYAAMLQGTTEFRKMEGITLDPDTNVMYLAMSAVERGMEDVYSVPKQSTKYDIGGKNDIRVPFNRCGVVYALDLDDNYVAKNMYGVVTGIPVTESYGADNNTQAYDPSGPFAKNKCHLDGIANPDNVTFMPGYKTLIIGEDTGSGHQNDLIWSYNIESKELTRIQTTPYGSETTSPYFYPDINGWAYLMSVVQHPYGESDADQLVAGSGADKAYTGYIGPLPAMN